MAMEFLSDKSLYDIGDNDLKELWDSDFDSPMSEAFTGEQDWTHLLDNQPVILNDRMITDAVQSPRITSEHSYSLVTNDDMSPGSPPGLNRLEDFGKSALDNDLESECFPAIPMNTASGSHTEIFIKQEPLSAPSSPQPLTCSSQRTVPSQSILKQPPTIILASRPNCQSNSNRCLLLSPKVKVEPMHTGFSLPPTPPSSTSSDSEGSLSPVHSHQPSSPSVAANSVSVSTGSKRSISQRNPSSTPLISSQPKGATGVLILTEEEKRTLLAEGYPIPSRLPLTKSEEKSLKKIRRKIKNKISAQESRRKKKEYMDALEKKVEALNNENSEYKKKLDSLENSNKSLLCQLQKLQTMLGDVPNRLSRNISTQTTTSVMVLVLCFTVFLGSWGPFGNFFISSAKWSLPLQHSNLQTYRPSFLPDVPKDPYTTPNKPSRTLLGIKDDSLEGIDHKMETIKDPDADHSLASDIPQTLNHLLVISDDHVQSSVQSFPLPANEEPEWIASDPKKSSSSLPSTSPMHSPDMVTSVNATHLVALNASEKQALKATA